MWLSHLPHQCWPSAKAHYPAKIAHNYSAVEFFMLMQVQLYSPAIDPNRTLVRV